MSRLRGGWAAAVLGNSRRCVGNGAAGHIEMGLKARVYHRDPEDNIIPFYVELDLMKDEAFEALPARPWQKSNLPS